MCGIAGFVINSHEPKQAVLDTMLKAVQHRGPDAQLSKLYKNVGFAHARLKIIDVSDAANQPFESICGNYVLIFNGEIYNHLQIRQSLKQKTFITHSDTETLLYALIEKGQQVLDCLNGIFAFAFLDIKNAKLLLARDRFGVKPLYYSANKRDIYFASELRAFRDVSAIDSTIYDELALKQHVALMASVGDRTVYQNIKKLEPGSYLIIDTETGQFTKKCFFEIPQKRNYLRIDEGKIIKDVDHLLNESVKRQLMSDVPIGFFLSGGLDSSLLVAIAQKHLHGIKPVYFTVKQNTEIHGFENDYPYAQSIANFLNVDLKTVDKQVFDIESWQKILDQIEEPIADTSAFNVELIASTAQKEGVKVLFSGLGADDVFTGYRRHLLARYYPLLKKLQFGNMVNLLTKFGVENTRLIKVANSWHDQENVFLENLMRYVPVYKNEIAYFRDFLNGFDKNVSILDKALALEQTSYLPNQNLLYTDKVAMQHGLEVRVPYLDNELVDYLYHVPAKFKVKGLCTKYILKKVAEKYLPNNIIHRKKVGFSEPLNNETIQQMQASLRFDLYDDAIFLKKHFDIKNINSTQQKQLIVNLFSVECFINSLNTMFVKKDIV